MNYKDIALMNAPVEQKRKWKELDRVKHGQEFEEMVKWIGSSGIELSELDKAMLGKVGKIHQQELKKELEARLRKLFAGAGLNYELEKVNLHRK